MVSLTPRDLHVHERATDTQNVTLITLSFPLVTRAFLYMPQRHVAIFSENDRAPLPQGPYPSRIQITERSQNRKLKRQAAHDPRYIAHSDRLEMECI